ncbi:hypothetical protein F511_38930 [Dorcoceras hygrometricum]|uniref:Uncharacterized protein n=1 Tax=Dorcoceras hygrometricum TaxID=472368 RepID=A0A2Z7BIP4_9LAMI|nr:hypothetical protein F511_38930 [Dorcoceras hygrometricum]
MSNGYAKLATGFIATAGSLKLSTGCVVACVWLSSWLDQTLATGCPAASCWYLATAGLKPSADYDDVTDDVINAKPSADSSARPDELPPRRGPRERRTSRTGEYVRIPTTNEHSSEGAGDVSGEAPPMLKSAVHARANESEYDSVRECARMSEYVQRSKLGGIYRGARHMNRFACTFCRDVGEVPDPEVIAAFCRHIQLSPSQLAPNSYSFLLALAVLLSYHEIPLIPYVLMQLVQIKRLGPGKFYLSHKGDHTFIKGNPSSHKGWMSRFFYIKCDVMRDPWRCEMHWRDSAVTLVPRTPDRALSLTPFLEAMHGKSYNAPELIKEDLLCFYKFSRKGVELVGDLDERMGKAELLKGKARNVDVVGHFSTNLAAAVAWGGELVKRLTQTYQKMNASHEQFDRAMGQHTEMLALLEGLEAHRAREEGEAKAQREALEAQLVAEREAHEAEKAARELLEAELEEVKARARKESERLKIESREEFLKSPEFDTLLGKKAGGYFKNGFRGCLAQWRANGYFEEEHPASFLDVQQVIIEMADEEEEVEEEEEEEEEGDGTDATPPSSPPS